MEEEHRLVCDRCQAILRADVRKGRQDGEPPLIAGAIIRCGNCCYINRFGKRERDLSAQ